MLNTIALIPARKGSKRFPGKNTALLGGKPLIAHSIEYALLHMSPKEILVSSDDMEVLTVAKGYNVETELRPAQLCQDDTPTAAVVEYHAHKFAGQGRNPDLILLLQPTNPLRPKDLLWDAMNIMLDDRPESIVSVSPLRRKFGRITGNTFIPENYTFGQRSQDLDEKYYENGLLYLFSFEYALEGTIQGDDPHPIIVDTFEGEVDIDTEADLHYAQFLLDRNRQ
jgi:CMP-N-acetylneuraminic acid synthetase